MTEERTTENCRSEIGTAFLKAMKRSPSDTEAVFLLEDHEEWRRPSAAGTIRITSDMVRAALRKRKLI
jgi:DNA-directed RNA polymerase specialized sigma24 family protein